MGALLMTRLVLLLVAGLPLLFAGLVGAIRAGANDSHALEALIAPSTDCPPKSQPCFMGLRPGATSVAEAFRILETHPWVDEVLPGTGSDSIGIYWTWSGQQPNYIDATRPGLLLRRNLTYVTTVKIHTHLTYADIWLTLGQPYRGYIFPQRSGMVHGVYYPDYSLHVIAFAACPSVLDTFWRIPVMIQFGDAYVALNSNYMRIWQRYRTCV
jgi:hypothetical protein